MSVTFFLEPELMDFDIRHTVSFVVCKHVLLHQTDPNMAQRRQ